MGVSFMKNSTHKLSFLGLALSTLAACGGGGGSDSAVTIDPLTTQVGTASASIVKLSPGTKVASSEAGTYDYSTGEVTVNATAISLDTDSPLSKTTDGTAYSFVSALNDAQTDTEVLVGLTTPAANIPTTGTLNYAGQAEFTVVDGASYEGIMESSISADFENSLLDIVLNNASGITRNDGINTTNPAATGTESITIEDLAISGTGFVNADGSSFSVSGFTGANIVTDTDGGTLSASGIFAGTNAEEAAGSASIDANNSQTLVTFSGTSD